MSKFTDKNVTAMCSALADKYKLTIMQGAYPYGAYNDGIDTTRFQGRWFYSEEPTAFIPNANETPEVQMFILLHEVGHHVIGQHKNTLEEEWRAWSWGLEKFKKLFPKHNITNMYEYAAYCISDYCTS